jgi:long-chain acyl-CoA synthetase
MDPSRNLVELVARSCAQFAARPVFGTKRDGGWVWTSYRELQQQIDRCRAGLHARGVRAGDMVAIVSDNSLEWAVACYATYGLQAAFVPLYPAQQPAEWRFILNDSGAKLAFARTGAPYDELLAARPELPQLEHLVGIGLAPSDPSSFDALLEAGARAPIAAASPAPEELAGLIYTSGTTGNPKGVRLSHANVTSNVLTASAEFPLSPDDRLLSFLPWAHAFGQLELHYGIKQGASLALNDDIQQLLPNLAEVKPTMLVTVPRIFHRVYDAVRSDIAERPQLLQKLFADGVRCATRRNRGEHVAWWQRLELELDDKLIFRKIRDRFGGRLKYVICASAALGLEVARFIDALGIEVYEGYGLTETSPMVSANFPGARRMGSVGKVVAGVSVVIDREASPVPDQGEIVVYGPNVMQGYHNRPEENAKVFTDDGGLRTGDLGYADADGYLYITGRVKEQYKLTNGKYVMPGPLEEELKLSHYVTNVMLHGANQPYNVALVVLNVPAISAWAAQRGIELDDPARDARVEQLILAELRRLSAHFRGYEAPRRVLLTTDEFTTANDLLTPTLKLKRRNVELRYGAALDALYAEPAQTLPLAR